MKNDDRTSRAQTGSSGSTGGSVPQASSFEGAMKRLGEIVEQLESGELPLEESLRLFEEGMELSKRAGELLDQAQRKVEVLTRAGDGTLGTAPFAAEPEDSE